MKTLSKLISILFLGISIIFLLYTLYRSELIHQGTRFDYYLKYYLFGIFLIILSIISFFIDKEMKIDTCIILFSSMLGLYVVEGYFFLNSAHYQVLKSDIKFDVRTKLEIYQDLKKNDPNVVVSVSPDHYLNEKKQSIFPLSGISKKKTIFCNENGYYSIYQSDRYGFNNPDNVWDKKKNDFLLLGDSFVNGACVNEPDTISGNLRKLIQSANIINIGYSGNGPLREYAALREYLPLTNSKKVLWFYFEGNDLTDLIEELNNNILLKYLEDRNFNQNLKLRQDELDIKIYAKMQKNFKKALEEENSKKRIFNFHIPKSLELNILIFQNFYKLYNVRRLLRDTFSFKSEVKINSQNINPKFKKILKLAKEFAERGGSSFYFIYLPEFARYSSFDKGRNKSNKFNNFRYKTIIQIVNDLEIPIIDIHKEVFITHRDPLSLFPFRSPHHYNELGYKLISEVIFKKIME